MLDRGAVEQLFGLGRRQAIHLLRRFGGYLVGGALVVERAALAGRLESLRRGAGYEREERRQQRLQGKIDQLRRFRAAARVRIPVRADVFSRRVRDLPPGVSLRPGNLQVEFRTCAELLEKLFEIGQAAANDFETFQAAVEEAPGGTG